MKAWRRFWHVLGQLDLLEYLIGAAFSSGIEGLVFWAGGFPPAQVIVCVIFALTGSMFLCCLIEIFFFDHEQ